MPHANNHTQVDFAGPDSESLRRTQHAYVLLRQRDPDNADALHALGVIAHQRGDYQNSLDLLTRAVAADPHKSSYYVAMGVVCEALGRTSQAMAAYRRAISLQSDNAEAHHNMAIALQSTGDSRGAADAAMRATRLRPDCPEFHNTLGYALRHSGEYYRAIDCFKKAVSLKRDYAEAYNQLGVTLNAVARYEEAIESYYQAILNDPEYAEAHWNIALVLLLTGRFAEGWRQYQWRRHPDLEMLTYPHALGGSAWDGSKFLGKTLLVHYEQGFGDTLQFVRYLPLVKSLGGTVILEVRKPLRALLGAMPGVDAFVDASPQHGPNMEYDLHVSLMDLPGLFAKTEPEIPSHVPYIHADKLKIDFWRQRLDSRSLKVGVVWSGSTSYERNNVRSCRLENFAPLDAVDGVTLYSLQKGEPASEIEGCRQTVPVVDLGRWIEDFADTAAAIANMDLLVSVDTSVLHLAGAMGKPAWALICAAPEWRWLLDREDSPWYPTIKLFRQKQVGRWDEVFQRVRRKLELLTAGTNANKRATASPLAD